MNNRMAREITRRCRGYAMITLGKFLKKTVAPQIDDLLEEAEHYYWWTEEPHVVKAKKEILMAAKRLITVGKRLTTTDKPPKGYLDRVRKAKDRGPNRG